MKFATALLALASSALAAPPTPLAGREDKECMTRAEAADMVEIYRKLIAEYKAEDCEKYCAADFVDNSDSINSFLDQPLGGPTFATKEIFMEAQLSNPPFPVVVDSIAAVDCDVVALRWHATFGEAMKPSKGITILTNTKEAGYWQIKVIDVEFNSLTWLLDMGGNYTWDG
ncbi:uncharacterized protein E0L32_009736 [Thyridium curvatum]|uniref:NTF2-like domain-containing protein n=1 Tax=Thyridium curvatum TaxID=1093900 RepID=A0A507APY2_9PEZI|nr:uncharacterized protein E0L32_009736 [Thyridium curvatum]TPX08796.1 hypothetical protein E0L32_009736 [Thyridium curvatum]